MGTTVNLGALEAQALSLGPKVERLVLESIIVSFLRQGLITEVDAEMTSGGEWLNALAQGHVAVELEVTFGPGSSERMLTLIEKRFLALSLGLSPDSLSPDQTLATGETDTLAEALDNLLQTIQASAPAFFPTPSGDPPFGMQIVNLSDGSAGLQEWTLNGDLLRIIHRLAFDAESTQVTHLAKPEMITAFSTLGSLASGPTDDLIQIVDQVVTSKGPASSTASSPSPASTSGQHTVAASQAAPQVSVRPAEFSPLTPTTDRGGKQSIDLVMDVSLRVTVELGRANMTIRDILGLAPGSIVELDKLAGEAVDILVNDRLIAKGEVVVVDENFGVRVTELITPAKRGTSVA